MSRDLVLVAVQSSALFIGLVSVTSEYPVLSLPELAVIWLITSALFYLMMLMPPYVLPQGHELFILVATIDISVFTFGATLHVIRDHIPRGPHFAAPVVFWGIALFCAVAISVYNVIKKQTLDSIAQSTACMILWIGVNLVFYKYILFSPLCLAHLFPAIWGAAVLFTPFFFGIPLVLYLFPNVLAENFIASFSGNFNHVES